MALAPKVQQAGAQSPEAGETSERTTDQLVTDSLERDIATASYDELLAWSMVLELGTELSESGLRQQLRDHYGLTAAGAGTPEAEGRTRIVIESASRSEYLQIQLPGDEQESVVRLSGNVIISVEEADRGRTHTVEAESVTFNQEQKTISAAGNIRYTVDTAGREEHFTGDSLLFEVTDWTGVIFRGTSERTQEVDGETVDFFFRGDSIRRAGKDILILDDGAITSHDSENPDYALKARKIWITGPGEWGLFSATLYVGHIPVFYLPFYWKSGSDLLFNPVLGIRTRSGYYIQTTTYFLGRKEPDDGYSILGFGDTASEGYDVERDGLFLVRRASAGESAPPANTLKFMLDYYTSLGGMAGFLGEFPSLGPGLTLDFYTSIGVSRSVDDIGNPYFNDGTNAGVYWNSSYLGPVEVPFRWASRFDLRYSGWSFYADWYSDPFYLQDFDNRQENFDWLSFLLSEDETDADDSAPITNMRWEIKGSQAFTPRSTAPWLQSVSVDTFRTALIWRNKSNEDVPQSVALPGYNPQNPYDPARNFYYPDSLVLPDLKVSLRGSSPTWSIDRIDQPTPSEDAAETLEPPKGGEGESNDRVGSADYLDSFQAVYNAAVLDAAFNYGLQSQLYIEDESSSESWDSPSEIDFTFEAARVNTTQRSNISYGIDFWDGLTGMKGATNLSGYYQTHSDLFGSDTVIADSTKLEDYRYSQFLWDNSFSLYLKPFQGAPAFRESSLDYSFDANLFAYRFDNDGTAAVPEYSGSWIQGQEDIRRHEAAARGVWKGGPLRATATGTGNIPPLDQRFTLAAGLDLSHEGWKAGVSQQTNYANEAWTPQPIVMDASWTGWQDEVTVAQNGRYDAAYRRWSSTESTFRFWGFETRFAANWGPTYKWNNFVWTEGPDAFRPSTLRFSYTRDIDSKPLWRRRIRYKTILDTSWNINLKQPTDNVLEFKWTQELAIYQFLDLRLSFSSANASMYLYFDGWRDRLGIDESYNFFQDLFQSFNFFNPDDRRSSQFNMNRIDLEMVHHLRNWDLALEYSGWPALDSDAQLYRWKSEFSVFMKWNPLPMFNQRTRFEDDAWTVDSFETDS